MKRILVYVLSIVCLLTFCACNGDSDEQLAIPTATHSDGATAEPIATSQADVFDDIKVMSFNVAADESDLSIRGPMMLNAVNERKPDSIGFQEARPQWLNTLKNGLKDYAYVGVSAEGEVPQPYSFGNFIFYLKDKYTVKDSGTFWLSRTPDEPSIYPGADCNRFCTWAILENIETGSVYVHINAHLDWKSNATTTFGAKMVLAHASKFIAAGMNTVTTGDYNDTEDSEMYSILTAVLGDSRHMTENTTQKGTYNDFGGYQSGSEPILDYCMVSKNTVKVNRFDVVDDKPNDKFISDHFGVYAELSIKRNTESKEIKAPSFAAESNISTNTGTNYCLYSFPRAASDTAIVKYTVSVKDKSGTEVSKEEISSNYFGDSDKALDGKVMSLNENTQYEISVTAVDMMDSVSNTLKAEFTTLKKAEAGNLPEADILNVSFEGGTCKDISKNALAMTKSGNPQTKYDEAIGKEVGYFSGSAASYKFYGIKDFYGVMQKSFTVECCFKFSGSKYENPMSNMHAGGFGFAVKADGTVEFQVHDTQSYVQLEADSYSGGIKKNTYYHLAAVYDGKSVVLYVNGELTDIVEAKGMGLPTDAGARYLCIGADSSADGNSEYYFTGSVAVARMYSNALSAAEIQALYSSLKI